MAIQKKTLRLEQTTMGAPSVGAGGHIDVALGTFDRPGPNPEKDNEKAVVPSEMVATQLATDRPPVEDDDYVPNSLVELAKASAEIAKLIPPDQVKKFYLKLKELADDCAERQEITTLDDKDMLESKKKVKIVKMIREALDDMDAPLSLGKEEATYDEIVSAFPEEFEEFPTHRRYDAARKADMMGQSKLFAMLDKIPDSELEKIMKVAKDEYVDLFEEVAGEDVDPEDIKYLKQMKPMDLYDNSDTFKFFFKAAFVMQSTDKFKKTISKIDRDMVGELFEKLKTMGVPDSALSAATNQIMGATERSVTDLKKKFVNSAMSGEMRQEDVEKNFKNFMMKFADLERKAKKERTDRRGQAAQDFVKDSLDSYSQIPLEKRKALLLQAFQMMNK